MRKRGHHGWKEQWGRNTESGVRDEGAGARACASVLEAWSLGRLGWGQSVEGLECLLDSGSVRQVTAWCPGSLSSGGTLCQ